MIRSALKHFPLVLVIIVSFAFVGFALAHENGDPAHAQAHVQAEVRPLKPLDLIRDAKQTITQGAVDAEAQFHVETKDRMASSSDLRAKVKGAIRMHAGLIKERFVLALRQFEKLTTRIESRIEKLQAEGVATASVEADLAAAKTANAEAKADAQAVADFVATIDESADRAAVRTELQSLIKDAQASIRAAHQALQKTIRSLVALAKENKQQTDTSASVEAEAGVEINN